jgi:hypothetical protein
MHPWLWGITVLVTMVVSVLSQDRVEPFRVTGAKYAGECEWVTLIFEGGIKPYKIYYAVGHGVNQDITWSQETLITTEDSEYSLFIGKDLGMFLPEIQHTSGIFTPYSHVLHRKQLATKIRFGSEHKILQGQRKSYVRILHSLDSVIVYMHDSVSDLHMFAAYRDPNHTTNSRRMHTWNLYFTECRLYNATR